MLGVGGRQHEAVQQLWHPRGIRPADVHQRQGLRGLPLQNGLLRERGLHDDPADRRGDPRALRGLQRARLLPRLLRRRVLRSQRPVRGLHHQSGGAAGAKCARGEF